MKMAVGFAGQSHDGVRVNWVALLELHASNQSYTPKESGLSWARPQDKAL